MKRETPPPHRLSKATYRNVLQNADTPLLRLMVERDGAPDRTIQTGYYDEYNVVDVPLLCYAALSPHHAKSLKAVQVLQELGATTDARDSDGHTALCYAAMAGNVPLLAHLLAPGSPLAGAVADGGPDLKAPIYWAASRGQVDAMRFLAAQEGASTLTPGQLALALRQGEQLTSEVTELHGDYLAAAALLQEWGVDFGSPAVTGESGLSVATSIMHSKRACLLPLFTGGGLSFDTLGQGYLHDPAAPQSVLTFFLDGRIQAGRQVAYYSPIIMQLLRMHAAMPAVGLGRLLLGQPDPPTQKPLNDALAAEVVRQHPPGSEGAAHIPPQWMQRGLAALATLHWHRRRGLVLHRVGARARQG